MIKKILSLLVFCFVFGTMCCGTVSYADEDTRAKVESIISGEQDYLVLANIIEKGQSSYEVEVYEEIGFVPQSDETKDGDNTDKSGILDMRINVEGFNNYMYYDNYDYRPQKGDNVLLSLQFNGNTYSIKNGAFRVDSTSHEQFSFMIPESFKGSEEALELNALYIYTNSNGEINTLSIKDGSVYGKDENGEDKKVEILGGLKFIDEYGDTSHNPAPVDKYNQTQQEKSSKWRLVFIIIVLGAISGAGAVKFANKFDKRYD